MSNFSDYIVFVDESGDHGIKRLDPDYPIFVLVFMIIHKNDYIDQIVPAMQRLKFKYWGHDQVILHENELRKGAGQFNFLQTSRSLREEFHSDLAKIIKESKFEIICQVVDKQALENEGLRFKNNFYNLSLRNCLRMTNNYFSKIEDITKKATIVVESRGNSEDIELSHFFNNQIDPIDKYKLKKNFEMLFSDKKANSTGLQMADLVARPIGLNYLRPHQPNRAYDLIEYKIHVEMILPSKS